MAEYRIVELTPVAGDDTFIVERRRFWWWVPERHIVSVGPEIPLSAITYFPSHAKAIEFIELQRPKAALVRTVVETRII